MTIVYKINETDYLIHQLFAASKSDRIKKKRFRNKVIIPLLYFAFGILFLFQDKFSLSITFIGIGILWFFIYPIWEKQHYINHYKGFIKENYKERIGRTVSLEINNELLIAKENGNESKVLTSEIVDIYEIPKIILIRLKGGQSFILPKEKIINLANLIIHLNELASFLKIEYVTDQEWEWK